jgi:hypothetical protein
VIVPTKELPGPRNWSFREVEKIPQEDGQIAVFFFDSEKPDLGWMFDHLEDKWGFIQIRNEGKGDFAKLLLESECDADRKLKSTGKHHLRPAKDPEPISAEERERRWSQFAFPIIIKNIAPGDYIMGSFLSVQPMTGPIPAEFTIPFRVVTEDESRAEKISELEYFNQALGPDELLKQYVYGGILAERGGYFIVHKDRPDQALRYQQTWLS